MRLTRVASTIATLGCLLGAFAGSAHAKSTAPIVASLDITSSRTIAGACEVIWGATALSTPARAELVFHAVDASGAQIAWTSQTLELIADELAAASFAFPVTAPGRYTVFAACTMYVAGGQYAREDSLIVDAAADGALTIGKERALTCAEVMEQVWRERQPEATPVAALRTKGQRPGLDVTLTTKPSPESTAAFVVSGRLCYTNKLYTNGAFTGTRADPIGYARVEIYDREAGAPQLLGTTASNYDGSFSFTVADNIDGPGEGGRDIFVRVYSENYYYTYYYQQYYYYYYYYYYYWYWWWAYGNAIVKDMSGAIWYYDFPVRQDWPGGTLDLGQQTTPEQNSGPFNIYDTAFRAQWAWYLGYYWYETNYYYYYYNYGPPILFTFRWAPGNALGTYYDKANARIDVLGATNDPDEFDDDVILREYSQFCLDKFSVDKNPGGDHSWDAHTSRQQAWSEGFAYFFASANRGTEWQVDHTKSSYTTLNLELPTGGVRKIDCEGAIAAALWDTWDSVNDGRDAVQTNQYVSIYVLTKPNYFKDTLPCTICDWVTNYNNFVRQYSNYYPNIEAGLNQIFADHGINCAYVPPMVTYPSASGLVWQRGRTYQITWSDFSGASVKIELCRNGSVVRTISAAEVNDGAMNWTVPADQAAGSDYKIHIISTTDPTSEDYSDNPFTIMPAPLVVYPSDTGIKFTRGSAYVIKWDYFLRPEPVEIALWKGGVLDHVIANAETNDGSYLWTVPNNQAPGKDYKIKIVSLGDWYMQDASDNDFEIIGGPRVLNPSDPGITMYPGVFYPISWTDFPTSVPVRIELYKGAGFRSLITLTTPNDGVENWVPPSTENGNDYRVKIITTTDTTKFDYSDNYFTIAGFPQVDAPSDPGIVIQSGGVYQIKWSNFPGINVRVDLYKDWRFRRTLFASTPNDGAEDWTVPPDEGGANYRIRIVSADNSSRYDYSDYGFTIATGPRVIYPSVPGIVLAPDAFDLIEWADFPGPFVKIELYKGAALRQTIYASEDNIDVTLWQIPFAEAGSDYRIKITSLSDPTKTDFSDNYFTIRGNPRVTYPSAAGIALRPGQTCALAWADYPGAQVKIELYKNWIYRSTIVSATANDGTENWTVPAGESGADYLIKITSTSDSSKYDFSNSFFAIAP